MSRIVTFFLSVVLVLILITNVWAFKEFGGKVEKMPEKGYSGEWVIAGKSVQVTDETKIEKEHGELKVGSYVKVEGVTCNGKMVASEIETEDESKK
jgi:hypothetical protein